MDLLKLVDNHIKACFLGKRTPWKQLVLPRALSRTIQLSEGIEQCDIQTHSKRAPTAYELAHQHSEIMMSPAYVRTRMKTVATEFYDD